MPQTPINRQAEPTDAEIEAIIADAIAAEASVARREAQPPSSAIVWWRAQMRARQEAARAVERPLTIVHAVAIACCAGLLASLVGTAIAGVKGSFGFVSDVYTALTTSGVALASIDLTGRWIMVPMTAMLVTVVVASIAALVIFADE
jgi:hypothetical protein